LNPPPLKKEDQTPIDDVEKMARNIAQNKDDDLEDFFAGNDFFDFESGGDLDFL